MDSNTLIVTSILAVVLSWYLIYSHLKTKIVQATMKASHFSSQCELLTTELQQERQLLAASRQAEVAMDKEVALLRNELKNLTEKYTESLQRSDQEQDRFEHLATQIIQAKTETFDKQHKEGIKEILAPLKERIHLFEQQVYMQSKESVEQHATLRSQINQLKELNLKITDEAANLTKALKGDNKVQGSWGELILESVLEKSGLEKDREYFVQLSLSDNSGKQQRPDVVIALPDGKRMIIDSKVSLTAYEAMVNADNNDSAEVAAKAHVRSIKTHVDGLSGKNYHELYQMESPDFVLMFVPIETAFAAAVQRDEDLYGYAFDKNIVIVTPATLLATLKTVDTMWTNDKQHRNALNIASEAGKMYDKLSLLVDDLIGVGKRIEQTQQAYQESMKKLTTGHGNLISRAEKIKALGAKANKSIDGKVVNRLGSEY